jgi:glycosyltransferase involved in cell wall biosynthesis
VVVPAHNEEASLGATLRSLAVQDFAGPVEVLVVDNASTDGTARVAEAHGARVLAEPQQGVCRARQTGTDAARGEVVVSTDADTVHPRDWLSRIDARLRERPDAVAVAGPCRYRDAPGWVDVLSGASFAGLGRLYAWTGRVGYVTATNLAFRRDGFPGYDVNLTQGGDEVDVLRRLRRQGPVVWDRENVVLTSSRRLDQGLAYTLVVSFGWHYAASLLLDRLSGKPLVGPAPAIRPDDAVRSGHRRRLGRAAVLAFGVALLPLLVRRFRGPH